MAMLTTEGLAYLTEDAPGIGGVIKQRPEDFVVEEMPREEPTGEGDFLYLRVEKVRRLTTDIVRLFSRHFGVPWDAVGYAGLKDKHAITRQWFSIEGATEDQAAAFSDDFIRILDIDRHMVGLSRGKLAGNRFTIRVREVGPAAVVHARRVLNQLARTGAPNFIGAQRFGYRNDAHLQGRALLLGNYQEFLDQLLGNPSANEPMRNHEARRLYEQREYAKALEMWPTVHRFERQALGPLSRGASLKDAVNGLDKPHRTLMISAFQSAIFNHILNERLKAGMIATLLPGDVAVRHDTGGAFLVQDIEVEQRRVDAMETSPSGPMWGRNMQQAEGETGERELEALLATGVRPEDLSGGDYVAEGARRSMRMPISEVRMHGGADEFGPYVEVEFQLPRGCFATVVMREIMK